MASSESSQAPLGFLDALAADGPPAAGAAAATVVAMAAALTELAARLSGDDAGARRARTIRDEAVALGDRDTEAYLAFVRSPGEETRREIVAVPRRIAGLADEVTALAGDVASSARPALREDAAAAATFARAAASVGAALAAANASD